MRATFMWNLGLLGSKMRKLWLKYWKTSKFAVDRYIRITGSEMEKRGILNAVLWVRCRQDIYILLVDSLLLPIYWLVLVEKLTILSLLTIEIRNCFTATLEHLIFLTITVIMSHLLTQHILNENYFCIKMHKR